MNKIIQIITLFSVVSFTPLMAITTDEIVQLHKAGVQKDTIINMIRLDGPKKPSVQDIIKLKSEKIPDTIIEAYTVQTGLEGRKPVLVKGPTLKVEDTISIAEYQILSAQANAHKRSIEIRDLSNNYSGLSEACILRYLLKKSAPNFSDELILAYVSVDGRYSRDFYNRVKRNEFELNKHKPSIIKKMMSLATTKNAKNISFATKIYIGEYDFKKGYFTPDFFSKINRGYIQVAGVRYPVLIENQKEWFTTLPLSERNAKQRLNISPNRKVNAQWGFTIKEVSKENGIVLHANTLNLMRDLNSGHAFWKYNMKYVGESTSTHHHDFPDDKFKNLGEFTNPENKPSNVRAFFINYGGEMKMNTFHDRFEDEESRYYWSLPKEQRKSFLKRRGREKYYYISLSSGQHHYLPFSKEKWISIHFSVPRAKIVGNCKFKKDKLNITVHEFKKRFFKTTIKSRMIYLDESQRDIFENGTLEQIIKL